MEHGAWSMGHGAWSMEHGAWGMGQQVKWCQTFKSFRNLFGYLMELSATRHFTLIIDEFQEFASVNPSVYSELQNIWDRHKNQSQLNLILCGSIYSMMKKIFEDAKEPLFGRVTQKLFIKPFDITTQKEMLQEYNPDYTPDDLLFFYTITGGITKYLEVLKETRQISASTT